MAANGGGGGIGRYRDDESGSIASLGMTHHTQAQSCDRGGADRRPIQWLGETEESGGD